MKVILRANWFVEGRRIRRGAPPSQPVEVPDHLRSRLPKGAVIVEEGSSEPSPAAAAPETFAEMVRSNTGRQSLVDRLGSNPMKKLEPIPEVENGSEVEPEVEDDPEDEPEVEPEVEPQGPVDDDVDELLEAAKAASGKKSSKRKK